MNELFDKLILRFIVAITISLTLLIFKYIHAIFYPATRSQLFKKFYPSKNSPNSIHLFSRIIGISIIFSGLYFNLEDGMTFALLNFFIQSLVCFGLYLISIFILESVTLFNFEYNDEIIKRKNYCYATINAAQAITVALILKSIIINSNNSLISLFFLWSFAIVLFGFSTKLYKFMSEISFNKLVIHKNMALAFSYSGHLFGSAFIIISSFGQELSNIETYSIQVVLKIILSIIILPIFQKGIILVFRIQNDHDREDEINIHDKSYLGPSIGEGIFEGTLFFASCYLTSVVTGHILFGNFYPLY